MQILIFPAGLVSRIQPDGAIEDLVWQKSFIRKAIEYKRDIIPVHFSGLNRRRFYRLAKWRKKLGLKVNIEQATLPPNCARRAASTSPSRSANRYPGSRWPTTWPPESHRFNSPPTSAC